METGTWGEKLGLGTRLPLCCCVSILGMPQTSAQPVTQHLYQAALVLDFAFLRQVSKSKRSWWTKGICEPASIQVLATSRTGISATSATQIWKIFMYPCLFTCISHFWLEAFNQHQCEESEACIAVGLVAAAQNVWGVGHLLLPDSVPTKLTQWLCLSATLRPATADEPECDSQCMSDLLCLHWQFLWCIHNESQYVLGPFDQGYWASDSLARVCFSWAAHPRQTIRLLLLSVSLPEQNF